MRQTLFEDPVVIHKVVSSLDFEFVNEHLSDITSLFSDIIFLEQQVSLYENKKLTRLYHEVLEQANTLVESLYISENRSTLSLVDKKFGEHITFRSQDRIHSKIAEFWDMIEVSNIDIRDEDSLRRSTMDTFFPLAIVYIHVLGYQQGYIKKVIKLYSKLSYRLLSDAGYTTYSEILSQIRHSKRYAKKMIKRL